MTTKSTLLAILTGVFSGVCVGIGVKAFQARRKENNQYEECFNEMNRVMMEEELRHKKVMEEIERKGEAELKEQMRKHEEQMKRIHKIIDDYWKRCDDMK